jgi:preprotein translocase subunit SecE
VAKQTTSTPETKPAKVPSSTPARKAPARSTSGATAVGRRIKTPSIGSFFQASYAELGKVTWPTRDQTMNLTVAVIVMTVSIALFLGLMDALLDVIVKRILGA